MTPPKALRGDFVEFMVMRICHELGKDEQEVRNWPWKYFIKWIAYFRVKNELEEKAMADARRKGGKGQNQGNISGTTTIIE